MSILEAIGYSQTYYCDMNTKRVTAKDGSAVIEANDNVLREERFSLPVDRKANEEKGPVPSSGKAPYSLLADENGIVEYKGIIFRCDYEKNLLCLGDVSNSKDVIRIPLSKGGCLLVNRDNINDLSKAIGMFSPEDVNLILRALRLDAKIQEMKKEAEEMEDSIGEAAEKKEEINMTENEPSISTGSESYTVRQWDKLMKEVDEAIDEMHLRVQEEKKEAEEAEQKKKEEKAKENEKVTEKITEEMLEKLLI